MKKIYTLLFCAMLLQLGAFAQSGLGTIRGTVKDSKTKKALDVVSITVKLNGVAKGTAITDDDGSFIIKTLQPGKYTLFASYVGYKSVVIEDINLAAEEDRFVNFSLESTTQLNEVVVSTYKKPKIDPGGVKGNNIGGDALMKSGTRSIERMSGQTLGVESRNGGTPIFRGARAEGTAYYIDGVRVQGGARDIPANAIDNIQVITGGTPAQYGDFVGGAISITTKAPSKNFLRAFEYTTASPFTGTLDNTQYNNFQTVLSGPIKVINKGRGDEERVLVGFLFSGSLTYAKQIAVVDLYEVKPDKMKEIEQTPLVAGASGTLFPAAEFLTANDLQKINTRPNVGGYSADVNGNFNYQPTRNFNVRLGYYGNYNQGTNWSSFHSLLNSANNSFSRGYTVRTYLQLTQTFKTDDKKDGAADKKSTSNISNAYYSVRLSYERGFGEQMDETHRDDIFNYGYVGKFTTYQTPVYTRVIKGINEKPDSFYNNGNPIYLTDYYRQAGYVDTAYTFEQSDKNVVRGNYTRSVYDFFGRDNISNLGALRQVGGLINGDNPNGIYSNMWGNVGANQTGYSKSMNETFNLYIQSEFTIAPKSNPKAKHEIQVGLNYEQQFRRNYGLNANGLWSLMRLYANRQFAGLDSNKAFLKFDENGVFQDTVNLGRKIVSSDQTNFDRNLRSKLMANGALDANGNPINEESFLDVNSYAPSVYSLDMYNADELLNNGNSIVSYSGYDHLGNVSRGRRPSVDDFLNDPAKRALPSYQPIYFAAWIQDKFVFKDLIMRVGLRLERFDANQPVLKDAYSTVPIYTVGEVKNAADQNIRDLAALIPNNMDNDFAVYVNRDPNQQVSSLSGAKLVGYRDGNRWFDGNGNPITDPQQIARDGKTNRNTPLLIDPNNPNSPTSKSFKDYTPDVLLLPRIWFSFPISTTSQFFGTYDILAQRPINNVGQIDDYFYLLNRQSGGPIANPNLNMVQVTDYEIGFRQQIGQDAALGIIASYREYRNYVQQFRYVQAWPIDYTTFGNIDFATVKSIGLDYSITDIGNITLSANYQLQFADGTGSNANSSSALIQVGLGTLRTIFPLDFDTRHTLKAVFDYHYKDGKDYNGPIVNGKKIFANAGFNLNFAGYSGRPFTQELNPTPGGVQSGVVVRSPVKGTINGANLPPQFTVDLNIDKNFVFKKEKVDGNVNYRLRVFVMVQNLLNTANITSVFRYTGSAYTDGFLASPASQEQIETATNTQSYIDLYNIRMVNPDRFALPRTARLGAALYF